MNNLIVSRGKEIIIGLLIVILILIFLLLKNPNSPATTNNEVIKFASIINDPKENVYGILLLKPDGHDKLRLFDINFKEVNHCFSDPKINLIPNGETIPIPDACKKKYENLMLNGHQQYIVLTAATAGKDGKQALLFVSDLDHQVKCTSRSGNC